MCSFLVSEAYEGQFTYQAQIVKNLSGDYPYMVCSGSILSEKVIITAAHCLKLKESNYYVFVGSPYRYQGEKYSIKSFHRHEQYDRISFVHDIGLIELKDVIKFSKDIAPIAINRNYIGDNITGVVSGWGEMESTVIPNSCFSFFLF